MSALTPTVNIYAQPQHHAEAFILGDKEGLTMLRDAINAALEADSGNVAVTSRDKPLFSSDGEGYQVYVIVDEDLMWRHHIQNWYTDLGYEPAYRTGSIWDYITEKKA